MRGRYILRLLGAAALALASFAPAFAQSGTDLGESIGNRLKRQGYAEVEVSTTLLGRLRITAERDGGTREIIVNPNTGEILRDLRLDDHGRVRASDILDDEDDDNSGPGSGGSGSSGSGSGSGGGGGGGGDSGGGDEGGDDGD